MQTNVLYYGDNLDILRRYIPDASVDLIYLDPPFNSNRDYNVIFRDESGNREREKAEIGLFITLEEPSREMELEATTAGFYTSPISGRDYPRIQILTIRELLEEGKKRVLPLLLMPTYHQAERIPLAKAAEQKEMFG
ncbi:MAG TPA: hypothetical protein VK992_02580 [Candidatus Caenarcaniphilales bacterium]|nr:hypothetical protein [Candidatus Caenarcaniphilales bacterium]